MPSDHYPVLLGLWDSDDALKVNRPLLAMADADRRIDLQTRYSVFVALAALDEAARTGWSSTVSDSGEIIRCFTPPLLPAAVSIERSGSEPAVADIQRVLDAAGLNGEAHDPGAADRARRTTMALVRDARFAKQVVDAYGGQCAMCGLGVPLVQAAHIFPAAAPGSSDHPTNGLALCPNHHLAFDRHLIALELHTRRIRLHPTLRRGGTAGLKAFLTTTFPLLATPQTHTPHRPPQRSSGVTSTSPPATNDWTARTGPHRHSTPMSLSSRLGPASRRHRQRQAV